MTDRPSLDYHTGDDFLVEFLDHRYGFSRIDFGQRVAAAARRLELVDDRDLDESEEADLVALAAHGAVEEPQSPFGRHLQERAAELDRLHAEPLSYWLRKLVFRGAWLDHRLKAGQLDVAFDEESGAFSYRMPTDQSPVVEAAPVPSWAPLRFTA